MKYKLCSYDFSFNCYGLKGNTILANKLYLSYLYLYNYMITLYGNQAIKYIETVYLKMEAPIA